MSNPIKWGIIGAANINYRFAPNFKKADNAVLFGIASRAIQKAEKAAKEFGAERVFESYGKLLLCDDIDVVYVPLPNSMHLEWIIKAAESGKHVLCEKPLTMNSKEAKRAVKVCEDKGVLLMEAFMYRHHPQNEKVKEIISSFRIGKALGFHSHFSFPLPPIDDIRWRKELGGGALMDLGSYCVNASRLIFESEPLKAKSYWTLHQDRKVDTTINTILQFPGERYASISCSFAMRYINYYEVFGSNGRIYVEPFTLPWDDTVIKVHDARGISKITVPGSNPYLLEIQHFSRCVQEGKLFPPAENGMANMQAIDLIRKNI